jgi:hypothetical protein
MLLNYPFIFCSLGSSIFFKLGNLSWISFGKSGISGC